MFVEKCCIRKMVGSTVGHYEILQKVGEGGMGAVYKARDAKLDRFVAVKTLSARLVADEANRRRFMQEAKAASALNHPNIITIHEIASWEGGDFIVMEFIEGRTLRSMVQAQPEVEPLIPIFRQLAEALAIAHASGIVHRDIKPDNIMVRSDGYVKVLDFGIARLSRHAEGAEGTITRGMTNVGAMIGTARYMSPEQARGELAESASDIFALGVVFYELATGQHPFYAPSTPAMLNAILCDTPAMPSRVNPQVPAAFDELLHRMLSKEAILRPSAADVRAALAEMSKTRVAEFAAVSEAVTRQSVGREKERKELAGAFQSASEGAWTLLCVTGEAGLGKTTLVEEFLDDLRARHGLAWIARGRCSERLSGTDALLPILECLDSLVRGDAGDQVARMLKRFAPTWYLQVAPSMGDSTIDFLAQEAKTASSERMKREIEAFFDELSRIRPVVLFFDDLHWSDVSTCDLLSYLGAKGRDLRVLVIATYRSSALLAGKHPFQQVKLQLQGRGQSRDLVLEFLTREDVERYIASKFPENRFPRQFFNLIHTKTEGNPLFMTDTLRYLRDRRILVEQDGVWTLAQVPEEIEKEMPASIRSMIQLKIDGFSEENRKLLVTGAVQGVQFDSAVLAKVLSLDPVDVEERLQELDKVHEFIRQVGELEFPDRTLTVRYRFVHLFYQNALYGGLTPSRRAATSKAVASTLLGFLGDKSRTMAADLAFLFEAARDWQQAATFYLVASRNAARVFAYPEAVILAENGLKATHPLPDSVERQKLELSISVTLGMSLMATKGYAAPEVERTHLRSRELCLKLGDMRRLFPVLWGLWTCYLIGGRMHEAMRVAEEMLGPAEQSGDPTVLVEALHAKGSALGFMGNMAEGCAYLERVFEIYHADQAVFYAAVYLLDPGVTTKAMLSRFYAPLGDTERAHRNAEEAVVRAKSLVHPPSIAYATFFLGWFYHAIGDVEKALETVETAMQLSREHGLYQIVEWGRVVRGRMLVSMGKVAEGVKEMKRSLDTQAMMHSFLERPYCLAMYAEGLAAAGQPEEALRQLHEAAAIMDRTEERSYEAEILRIKGELLAKMARENRATTAANERQMGNSMIPPEAEETFARALTVARAHKARVFEVRILTTLAKLDPAYRETLHKRVAEFPEGDANRYLQDARLLLGLEK